MTREAYCGEVVAFEPDTGPGYWDYPINGETSLNEYRSYSRRDVMRMVEDAAAQVNGLANGWTGGVEERGGGQCNLHCVKRGWICFRTYIHSAHTSKNGQHW